MLTENYIKRLGLAFLRHHYRFRTRGGTGDSDLDLTAGEGIVADARLTFQTPEGKPFVATVEATSQDVRDEVVYKIQRDRLLWDGLCVGMIGAVIATVYGRTADLLRNDPYGITPAVLALLLLVGSITLLYRFLARRLSRYHYIYAVEQFKRYHADEQWIVMGEDVLDAPEDEPYLEELKKQCIYNGFGLVLARRNGTATPLITPARHDLFGGRRQVVQLFAENRITQRITNNRLTRQLENVGSRFGVYDRMRAATDRIEKFRLPIWKQVLTVSGCLLLVVYLFARETENLDRAVVSNDRYERDQRARLLDLEDDERDVLPLDSSDLRRAPVEPRDLFLDPEEQRVITEAPTTGAIRVPENQLTERSVRIAPPSEGAAFIGKNFVAYDCDRLAEFVETIYVVEESLHQSLPAAQRRLAYLREREVADGAILWLGCTTRGVQRYAVLLGELYPDRREATTFARRLTGVEITYFDPTLLRVREIEL